MKKILFVVAAVAVALSGALLQNAQHQREKVQTEILFSQVRLAQQPSATASPTPNCDKIHVTTKVQMMSPEELLRILHLIGVADNPAVQPHEGGRAHKLPR